MFRDLTLRTWVDTEYDVICVIITYDSKYAVAVVNDRDEHFELQGYSLTTYQKVFEQQYKGTYIKMNQIEQSLDGQTFCIAYQDNGKFRVNIVNNQGQEIDTINASEFLGLDTRSKPISGFWEPLICACFIPAPGEPRDVKENQHTVFIACYHRLEKKQYHYTYSIRQRKPLCKPQMMPIGDCTILNFPLKAFYSTVTGNCHTFYRQGHGFTISAEKPEEADQEKITDDDMGSMYLLFDQALVTRSSSSILFFKIDEETGRWKQYHKFDDMRG